MTPEEYRERSADLMATGIVALIAVGVAIVTLLAILVTVTAYRRR